MNARESDEQMLAILKLRQSRPPSYVARKFGLTSEHVVKACRTIRDADIMHSKEEIAKIMLHYPRK
jgi:hypothetical protein